MISALGRDGKSSSTFSRHLLNPSTKVGRSRIHARIVGADSPVYPAIVDENLSSALAVSFATPPKRYTFQLFDGGFTRVRARRWPKIIITALPVFQVLLPPVKLVPVFVISDRIGAALEHACR